MKYIKKTEEPASLTEYKKTPGVSYEGWGGASKEQFRNFLVDEQGGICCYCGKRIAKDPSTILEHIMPREDYTELALDYFNIVASCDGGQQKRAKTRCRRDRRRIPSTCDDSKNNQLIEIYPTQEDCLEHFCFTKEGEIFGEDDVATEVIRILNLNCEYLKDQRKSAIAAIDESEQLTSEEWRTQAEEYMQVGTDGLYQQYCFAIYSYIIKEKCSA